MNTVFVDTGYLFALEITNDQHHQASTQHWQGIVATLPRLVTTSYVFDCGPCAGFEDTLGSSCSATAQHKVS